MILTISENMFTCERQTTLFTKRTNILYFQRLVEDMINLDIPLKSEKDIDDAVFHLTKCVQNSA